MSKRYGSVADRVAAGKKARHEAPRESHAEWVPAAGRNDPVWLLGQQADSRVPELVPIRYGRMVASPFAFYRGGALVMAEDLAGTPTSGFAVQACGDAHLSNFGLFASPERRLMFDVNDFDETHVAPWEWDVKRLAASIEIAGRGNGFSRKQRRSAVTDAVRHYRESMRAFAAMGNLDVWYLHATVREGLPEAAAALDADSLAQARKVVAKALSRDNRQALSRLSEVVDGRRRLIEDPPLVVPLENLLDAEQFDAAQAVLQQTMHIARDNLAEERRELLEDYRMVHLARKVVGVGSVGTRAWIALMVGKDDDDLLMLQIKEAQASVLEGVAGPSRYRNHGRRVVEGQKRMQAASDIFLSWSRVEKGLDGRTHDYYVRQLRDWKGAWEPSTMNPVGMGLYTRMCAWTLARAHARTGDRVAIAAYLGSSDAFDRAVAEFSARYADQNEQDHAALERAVADGRVLAQTGV